MAETVRGARVQYVGAEFANDEARAEKFARRVQEAVDAGRVLDAAHWVEDRPCYGSDEWMSSGIEAEEAAMERAAAFAY
jgi:hypothetical protein